MVNYFIQLAVGYSDAKLPYSHPEASGLYSEAYTQVPFIYVYILQKVSVCICLNHIRYTH